MDLQPEPLVRRLSDAQSELLCHYVRVTYSDPPSWRLANRTEMLAFIRKPRKKAPNRSLVLQGSVSPFDVYTYLHARFGPPNGMQTMLAADDSDNLFHWDYNLKAGVDDLVIIGATRSVHIQFGRATSDAACRRFIAALKNDFGRVAVDKGRFAGGLEKWRVFPNQFLTLANRCADIYAALERNVPRIERMLESGIADRDLVAQPQAQRSSRLMSNIMTAPTELSVLTPVMFESFLGLLVAVLVQPDFKKDHRAYEAFIRAPLNVKLVALHERCHGFHTPLKQGDPEFGRYWTVVNRRNDLLHGNVDPMRDTLEVVYFHGKRPLYRTGGERIKEHWAGLMRRYRPRQVMEDYIAAHEFIIYILHHLDKPTRALFEYFMRDTEPGWDNRRKKFGVLFPDTVATVVFEGLRYDTDL